MASPTPAPERRQWTDDYKRAIFAEFDALPNDKSGNRNQWLKDRKIAKPHFYRMRKAFMGAPAKPAPKKAIKGKKPRLSPAGIQAIQEAQRRRWAVAKAAGTGKYTKVKTADFRSADQETKYQLVREYDALPYEQKAPWRKAHGGIDTALVSYHRSRMPKEAPAESKAVVPYNHGQKIPTEKLSAFLTEYDAIQGKNGAKKRWLEEHGLNYSNIHEMRRRLVYHQQPAPAAQPQFIPAATPGPVITLDDAIAALQVRQDIWNEFMGLLKAMARGR
jgi:hypothetical protein